MEILKCDKCDKNLKCGYGDLITDCGTYLECNHEGCDGKLYRVFSENECDTYLKVNNYVLLMTKEDSNTPDVIYL